jgi:hypothetical protein
VVLAGAGRVIGSVSSSGLDSGGVCGRDLMVGVSFWAIHMILLKQH